MLVKDEAVQVSQARALQAEVRRQRMADYAAAILNSGRYFGNNPEDMARPDKNLGTPLREDIFLKKLSKIVDGGTVNVELHPTNVHIKFLSIPGHPTVRKMSYICEPQNGILPEYSTISVRKVKKYDLNATHIDRADLPKGEEVEVTGEDGERFRKWVYDEDTLRPGQYWAYEPHMEVLRGWRTILALLIQEGILSPERVEREFGVAQRASWKALLGKTASA